MYEDAQEIFEYLPIRRNTTENDYIDHLWQAFSALSQTETTARPFAVMPFHLLFMLALQYKVLRISKEQKEKYERKKSFIRKIHYTIGIAVASAFWYTFENRESVRAFLKEWLR